VTCWRDSRGLLCSNSDSLSVPDILISCSVAHGCACPTDSGLRARDERLTWLTKCVASVAVFDSPKCRPGHAILYIYTDQARPASSHAECIHTRAQLSPELHPTLTSTSTSRFDSLVRDLHELPPSHGRATVLQTNLRQKLKEQRTEQLLARFIAGQGRAYGALGEAPVELGGCRSAPSFLRPTGASAAQQESRTPRRWTTYSLLSLCRLDARRRSATPRRGQTARRRSASTRPRVVRDQPLVSPAGARVNWWTRMPILQVWVHVLPPWLPASLVLPLRSLPANECELALGIRLLDASRRARVIALVGPEGARGAAERQVRRP
jgi:hypothetical protein